MAIGITEDAFHAGVGHFLRYNGNGSGAFASGGGRGQKFCEPAMTQGRNHEPATAPIRESVAAVTSVIIEEGREA